jgi:hypothetical protein
MRLHEMNPKDIIYAEWGDPLIGGPFFRIGIPVDFSENELIGCKITIVPWKDTESKLREYPWEGA